MKSFLLTISALLFELMLAAQQPGNPAVSINKQIDSLMLLLKTAKEDTNKINLLIKIAAVHDSLYNLDAAKIYIDTALTLSRKTGFTKGEIKSLVGKAKTLNKDEQWEEALKLSLSSLSFSKKINDKPMEAVSEMAAGESELNQRNFYDATKHYQQALDIQKRLNDTKKVIAAMLAISKCHFGVGNYSEAIDNASACLDLCIKIKDSVSEALCYQTIAGSEVATGLYKESRNNFEKAIKINERIKQYFNLAQNYNSLAAIDMEEFFYDEATSKIKRP